ncbi:FixH family protein [Aneurinibacillus thermoaerophilus]|uniref:FixH family protein n=1 Tax=Aneurinibacillus thermoaerophilus TaxID=143495 RepID=UPI002E1C35E3|nr:FixH family protein [Aneurinibacillus thermoaerophilus]MED0765266.1 FixH family protein [Aneurinibacillus thermoaerophilus]
MYRIKQSLAFIILLGVLTMPFFAGCSEKNTSIQPQSIHPKLDIQIHLHPLPAKVLQKNELFITSTKTEDNTLQNAEVTITLSMAGMNHGKIMVPVEKKDGGFLGTITPTMTGKWVADIHIVKDGKTSAIQYTFEAVP